MSRRVLKVLLLSTVVAVPGLASLAFGQGLMVGKVPGSVAMERTVKGKVQDRFPLTEVAFEVATLQEAGSLPRADGPLPAAPLADAPLADAPLADPETQGQPDRSGRGDRRERRPPRSRFAGEQDALSFARNLAAAETALGIRSEQLDSWRAFTDALQAAVIPAPPPEPAPASPVEGFAAHLKAEGASGERLRLALDGLRARLNKDQLARFAQLEPALVPPPPSVPAPPPQRVAPPACPPGPDARADDGGPPPRGCRPLP